MPFDLVINEETARGENARVSRTSVCGSWGAVAGTLRFFSDKFGVPRAGIEGTQIPLDLIRKYATRGAPEIVFEPKRKHSPLVLRRTLAYFGFELERESEPIDEFPSEQAGDVRRTLAIALARGEVKHPAVNRHRAMIEEIRELYRRSGGSTPKLGVAELAALYERELADVNTWQEFRAAPLRLDLSGLVVDEERERLAELPERVELRDRDVEVRYDVEEGTDGTTMGVARLRLPEKLARTLSEAELPQLDRPLRFVVLRGQRGAVRAATLAELQDALAQPWTSQELGEEGGEESELPEDERRAARLAHGARHEREERGRQRSGKRSGKRGGGRRDGRPGGGARGGGARESGGREGGERGGRGARGARGRRRR
jgi:ATP-dependent helicase HrpA